MNEPNPVPYTVPQEPTISTHASQAITTPIVSVEPIETQMFNPVAVSVERSEPGVLAPTIPEVSEVLEVPEMPEVAPTASSVRLTTQTLSEPSTSFVPPASSASSTSSTSPTSSIIDPLTHQIPADLTHGVLEKSQYFNNSIFWIELEKIVPNPYQPRKEFDMHALKDLADSIRMYGLLQPLTVTRREVMKEDGGLAVQYELISGERRLRASGIAGLKQVPVIIRAGQEDPRIKLELAIIENLQREDLNPVDRARSFERLANEFGLKHAQIADKMGKSREYVTNSLRILALPAHIIDALSEKKITEGHTRPLLMLNDRPEEQEVLFREIMFRKMTVREAEKIARGVATEKVRKHDQTPELKDLERQLNEALGTRVFIEKKEKGGKVVIDFFNVEDVRHILDMLSTSKSEHDSLQDSGVAGHTLKSVKAFDSVADMMNDLSMTTPIQSASAEKDVEAGKPADQVEGAVQLIDDSTAQDVIEDDGMYSVRGFSI